MTYDDGVVRIYLIGDISAEGGLPVEGLVFDEAFHFAYYTLGISRFYTAKQAHQMIEAVIEIPGWKPYQNDLTVAILEGGTQYIVRLVQPVVDDDGLRVTRLSLERIHEDYVITAE